jgi:hypothetical protein
VVPIWYQWHDGAFWFVGRERSEWCRYIEADGGEALNLLWTTPKDQPGAPPRAIDAALLRHEPAR